MNQLFNSHGILTVTLEGEDVDLKNTTPSHFISDRFHLDHCCLKTGALCMFEYNDFLMAVQ